MKCKNKKAPCELFCRFLVNSFWRPDLKISQFSHTLFISHPWPLAVEPWLPVSLSGWTLLRFGFSLHSLLLFTPSAFSKPGVVLFSFSWITIDALQVLNGEVQGWLAFLLQLTDFHKLFDSYHVNFYMYISCPVGWGGGCRIHWLHLCRGVKPHLPMSVLDMTLNNLMVRFQQCWSFGECGVPLYCHCSQVHSGPVC